MWPKLRGQAGPAPHTGDQEPEPESDPQLELISVPDDGNVKHHDYHFSTFLLPFEVSGSPPRSTTVCC